MICMGPGERRIKPMVNAKTLDLNQLFAEDYIKTAEDVFRALDYLGEVWTAGREA